MGEEGICAYIRQKYPGVVGDPVVLWVIDTNWIRRVFPGTSFENTLSRGADPDPCHFEFKGLTNQQGRRVYKETWKAEDTFVCIDGERVAIQEEHFDSFPRP